MLVWGAKPPAPDLLLGELRTLGVAATVRDGKLILKPSQNVPERIMEAIKATKQDCIDSILLPCPLCHRPTRWRKCWPCQLSICHCGMTIPSPLLSMCDRCGKDSGPVELHR